MTSKMIFKWSRATCPDMTGANPPAGAATGAAAGAEAGADPDEPQTTATNEAAEVIQGLNISNTMANVAVPDGSGDINIANDFRWTKTAKQSFARTLAPVITLREMQVTVPAFFQNLSILEQQLGTTAQPGLIKNLGENIATSIFGSDNPAPAPGATDPDSWIKNAVFGFLDNMQSGVEATAEAANNLKRASFGSQNFDFPEYLKSYEKVYGVNLTNFIYRLPYLEDNYKTISNNWAKEEGMLANITTRPAGFMADIMRAVTPGVGIDFAKTFNYPDSGPSYEISFYLDNTQIDGSTDFAMNYRFIYLLLYQNLPNRINRAALLPPVIYQASLPGVFSYRWSSLSNININFIGTRRPAKIKIGGSPTESEVIIPEGYEVKLTLTSLTPETKNLMFDSINNPVQSHIEEPPKEEETESPFAKVGGYNPGYQHPESGVYPSGATTTPRG